MNEMDDSTPSTKMEPPTPPSTNMEESGHKNEAVTSSSDDPQPLRRPMNAFLLFCKRHRRVVKSQHPWLDNRSCTKMLADMWSVLDCDEKNKYLQLARECKAAFMKAHPGYKWCGSSKQNLKLSSPTVTTRTKLPLTPPSSSSEGAVDDQQAGHGHPGKTANCKSHMGITLGKLADPAEMGGLSLLLLAGQQAMGKGMASSTDASSPEEGAAVYPSSGQDSPTDNASRLFEFAEMCSSRQLIESSRKTNSKPPPTITTPPTTPVLPDIHPEWTNQKSEISIKTEPPYTVEDAANNNLPSPPHYDRKEHSSCTSKDKKSHKRNKKQKKKKKNSSRNIDKSKLDLTKIKIEGNVTRVSEGKCGGRKLVKLGEIKVEDMEAPRIQDGVITTSAPYDDDKCDDDETELPGGRRKSSRSCKGRLYREMVMGGMLESLQRPERPFNCKKPWRHSESTNYSDREDAVFEPEPEKPKRPSRRKSRKRTLSGCGSSLPADFDYGEIDVEARLATLPQYSPDQFQPRGKCRDRAKRSSSLYKNATFVSKKDSSFSSREIFRRSISNPEGLSTPNSPSLTGSQRRKARKCSIMHLTPTQDEKTNGIDGEMKCSMKPHQPESYSQQQMKSTRVRLEFPSFSSTSASSSANTTRCKDINSSSNNKQSVLETTNNSTSSSISSSSANSNGCVKLASRDSRSASQKACSSSQQSTALKIGLHQSTLTVP